MIDLDQKDESGRVHIDHGECSKQILEALDWVSNEHQVPKPKVLPVNGRLRGNGILLDGFFMLGKPSDTETEPVILLSKKPAKPVIWVLFHEFAHYREFLKTGTVPPFISLNSPAEVEADRQAQLDFRAYNTQKP